MTAGVKAMTGDTVSEFDGHNGDDDCASVIVQLIMLKLVVSNLVSLLDEKNRRAITNRMDSR